MAGQLISSIRVPPASHAMSTQADPAGEIPVRKVNLQPRSTSRPPRKSCGRSWKMARSSKSARNIVSYFAGYLYTMTNLVNRIKL